MPRAQTNVRESFFAIIPFLLTPLLSQRKVRQIPLSYPPTTAVCSTYLGDRQEPDTVAPWLLRTSSCGLLPDDPQNPAQAKLSPLGQVIQPRSAPIAAAAGGGSKKETKPKDGAATAAVSTAAAGLVTVHLRPLLAARMASGFMPVCGKSFIVYTSLPRHLPAQTGQSRLGPCCADSCRYCN